MAKKYEIKTEQSAIAPNVKIKKQVKTEEAKKQEVIRVAAYCRVSTDMEVQESSLETQMEAYNRKIAETPGWELAGIYVDKDRTGTMTKARDGFNQMIEDARAGKVDYIIAKGISRFARNTVDTLEYTRELKALGIGVYFEKDKLDTMSLSSEMVLTILAAFAQEESHSISENMKRGIRHRFRMGIEKWSNLFGYERGKDGEWIINEKEAKVIRKIYDDYYRGYGSQQIADRLNKRKIPSPSGTKWYCSTVAWIIANEKYSGDILMQKTYIVDHLTHKKVKNNDAAIEQYFASDHHPAIIPRELDNKVRMVHSLVNPLEGGMQYPYYGFLKCPYCGANLVKVVSADTDNPSVWICGGEGPETLRKDRSSCPQFAIPMKVIDRCVKKLLSEKSEEIKKDIEKRKTVHFWHLDTLVGRIDFEPWKEMRIRWKDGTESSCETEYEKGIKHPFQRISGTEKDPMSNGNPLTGGPIMAIVAMDRRMRFVDAVEIIDPIEDELVPKVIRRDVGIAEYSSELFEKVKRATGGDDAVPKKELVFLEKHEKVLAAIKENPGIKTYELCAATGICKTTVAQTVSELKEMGLIERDGGRKEGCWKVTEK